MDFYEKQFFHIYNQGNNRQQIFFSDENYKYFLWKMRGYLLPFGDLIAWCLMPNHFHWLFYVREVAVQRKTLREHVDKVEYQRRVEKYGKKAMPVNRAHKRTEPDESLITLNEAIGNLEKGYSQAINKEKGWTGRLVRENCKAKDGWIDEFITLKKNGRDDWRFMHGNDYVFRLMIYIHENPTKANLALKTEDYPWSSARDYAGLRNGTMCNLEMGRNILKYL